MIRTNVVRSALVVLAMLFVTSLQAQEIQRLRVYVFTAETKFVEADSKDRADSVLDIQKALLTKDKEVLSATDAAHADITLEVIGRGSKATGTMSTYRDPVFGGIKTSPDAVATVWVKMRLTSEDYESGIVGACPNGQLFRCWSTAANDVAGQVARWIKNNGARISRK